MPFKFMVKSLIAGVGILSFGVAGCNQPRNFEATSTEKPAILQTSSSPQATPEATSQAAPQATPTPKGPDVVYIPTPQAVVDEMLRLADVRSTDLVYDLGSGDGRIVITAAKQRGARGIGIDIDPQRVQEANENAKKAGVSDRVEFRQQDLFETDFSKATVVTLYLLPELNLKLRPRLLSQLKPGTRIVSHDFDMGDWKPDQMVTVDGRKVYYWVVPEKSSTNVPSSGKTP